MIMTKSEQTQLARSLLSQGVPSSDQQKRITQLRSLTRDLALFFIDNSPVCPDQTEAIKSLYRAFQDMEVTIISNERASKEPQ
jgi:alkyl hydroperoxide reductase subunit AhpC